MTENRLIEKPEEIELKSEGIQEIMGTIPGWIIRNGIAILFLTVALLITFSFVISFPKKISVPVRISVNDEFIYLAAERDGILEKILVPDSSLVKENQILAIIRNEQLDFNNYKKVLYLFNKTIEVTENYDYNNLDYKNIDTFKEREELKNILQSARKIKAKIIVNELKDCIRSSLGYLNYLQDNRFSKQISGYVKQIESKQKSLKLYREKKKLYQKYYALAKKQFERDSLSAKQTFISKDRLDNSKLNLLNYQEKLIDVELYEESLTEEIRDLKRELSINENIRKTEAMANFDKYSGLKNNLLKLLENYKAENIVTSPADGLIRYLELLNFSDNFNKGQKLFSLKTDRFSEDKQIYFNMGKSRGIHVVAEIPSRQSSRLKEGQLVKIKLEEYPYMEFGLLEGNVETITPISAENNYLVTIELKNGLVTTYNKKISTERELMGTGEIIIRNEKLIMELIKPLKSLMKNDL